MKILIAEDDVMTRVILQEMLADVGTTYGAENGREAIEIFTQALQDKDPFDLVCLDIMMPEINGQDALLKIRKIEEDLGVIPEYQVKVIMITALSDPENIMKAHIEGRCEAYMTKPIKMDQLLEQIKKLGLLVSYSF
ncbi:MAG: response regulator [Deltaproteobacteria bacterium]|nr:response regulator [Deltaproteobacteria bacterium]